MLLPTLVLLLASAQGGPPLFGYHKGEQLFAATLEVGGPEKSTGIKGDGITIYIVHIDGVGTTPGGRKVDGLYTFVDANFSGALPLRNARVQLLIGNSPVYRDFEFYSPAPSLGPAFPAFRNQNDYDFLWKPSPGDTVSLVSPNLKWTNPTDDPLSGSYNVAIFRAEVGETKEEKSDASAIDARLITAAGFAGPEQVTVPILPLKTEPTADQVKSLAESGRMVTGVAADGASLLLLRSVVDQAGTCEFRVRVQDKDAAATEGALYPLVGDPFVTAGSNELKVATRPSGRRHYAFAIYRPPTALGRRSEATLDIYSQHTHDGGAAGPGVTFSVKIVRPPVVLVHGTYDNPQYCWRQVDVGVDSSDKSMFDRLKSEGFQRVHTLDWELTNGNKDPSSFKHNQKTVWEGPPGLPTKPDGIRDALTEMRRDGIAVTQADLVCHSQGGVISRVYARGFPLDEALPLTHPHYRDPNICATIGCWFHRADNFARGDIHRLVTISTTHRGSDVCRVFEGFEKYQKEVDQRGELGDQWRSLILSLFLGFVDKTISGITTDGYKNQTPGSDALRAVGPTPVPSHAIACTCTDEEMKAFRPNGLDAISSGFGDYYGKLYKIYRLTPNAAKEYAMEYCDKLGEAGEYRQLLESYKPKTLDRRWADPDLDKLIYKMRRITFNGDDNDCTVARLSSFGGLRPAYTDVAEHVLHGWAPRALNVQNFVVELLQDPTGERFDPNGFPNYDEKQAEIAAHFVIAGGTGGSGGVVNPGTRPTGKTTPKPAASTSAVGTWQWEYVDNDVIQPQGAMTFSADGKVVGTQGQSGTWKQQGRSVTITWTGGRVDEMRVTSDGSTMLGHDDKGVTIRGFRKT